MCIRDSFYRGGAEQKIRKYLVDGNFVETVIGLPPNLFYGTGIAVHIDVYKRQSVLFRPDGSQWLYAVSSRDGACPLAAGERSVPMPSMTSMYGPTTKHL